MCEYCGCQALAAVDLLTREHDQVVDLIAKVRASHADDVPRMIELARRIATVLGPHNEVEEHGLFPALAGDFPDHIAELEAEHRRIEAVLAEAADRTPSDPAWPQRLLAALGLLRRHILKEQDGVFPAALAGLRTEQWETIDAIRDRVGTALPAATGKAAVA
jgi:hemerythrin-like domain-containing protein